PGTGCCFHWCVPRALGMCPGRSAAASGPHVAQTRGWCAADPGPPEATQSSLRRLRKLVCGACRALARCLWRSRISSAPRRARTLAQTAYTCVRVAVHCIRDTRSQLSESHTDRRSRGAPLPAEQASATEELRESPLVLLVLRQHRLQVARHDFQRRHRRIALRRRDIGEDREIALGDRLALRLLGELPVDEGLGGLDIAAALEHGDRLGDRGYAILRKQ